MLDDSRAAIWMRNKRAERLMRGKCVRCGRQPHREHHVTCESCAEKQREDFRKRCHNRVRPSQAKPHRWRLRNERIEQGLCIKCGLEPPRPDRRSCQRCADEKITMEQAYRMRDDGTEPPPHHGNASDSDPCVPDAEYEHPPNAWYLGFHVDMPTIFDCKTLEDYREMEQMARRSRVDVLNERFQGMAKDDGSPAASDCSTVADSGHCDQQTPVLMFRRWLRVAAVGVIVTRQGLRKRD